MLQMDLQKAYDTVEWSALESILKELSFPNKIIKWVMQTVTIVSYKFRINGDHSRFMGSKRGLHQGDPFRFYCGNVDNQTKQEIHMITNFSEGPLPLRYLGISLMSRKMSVYHDLSLVEKVMARVNTRVRNLSVLLVGFN